MIPANKFLSGLASLAALLCALFAMCTPNGSIAGGSSDAELSGCITDSLGAPVSHARVSLVPAEYIPHTGIQDSIPVTATNADGIYHFQDVSPGDYTVFAYDTLRGLRVAIPISIPPDQDPVTIPSAVVGKPGRATVILPEASLGLTGTLYLQGTEVAVVTTAADDTISIDSLPAGIYSFDWVGAGGSPTLAIQDSVVVTPGANTYAYPPFLILCIGEYPQLAEAITGLNCNTLEVRDSVLSDSLLSLADVIYIAGTAVLDTPTVARLRDISTTLIVSNTLMQIRLDMSSLYALDTAFGHPEVTGNIFVTEPYHPILQGLGDTAYEVVAIYPIETQTLAWGIPASGTASIAAKGIVSQSHATIYTYETGGTMISGTAPARRAGFFAESSYPLTTAGIAYLRNTIEWAFGLR